MKIEKSNNPAAVGALILVLVLIVGRIIWMVFGQTGSASAASTPAAPAATPSVPAAAPAASVMATEPIVAAKPTAAAPVLNTTRNPFAPAVKPAPAAARLVGLSHAAGVTQGFARPGVILPLAPLPPLPVQVLETSKGAGGGRSSSPRGLGSLPALPVSAAKPADPVPALKLTAIIDGTEPIAIVQSVNPQPVTLHVGDLLEGMRVVAIHEQDVVFARGTGFWTLPLQSATDTVAAGPVSVTPVAPDPASAISVTTSEENTDEQH